MFTEYVQGKPWGAGPHEVGTGWQPRTGAAGAHPRPICEMGQQALLPGLQGGVDQAMEAVLL